MSNEARSNLLRLVSGFQASQAISVAATLGLADILGDGPASARTLARRTDAHPDAMRRLLRVLAALGICRPIGIDEFTLTAMGEYLRRDARGSCAPMAELFGRPNVWSAWGDLHNTVKTGATAFDHVHGLNVWDFRMRHPDEAAVFDRAMASGTARFAEAILDACDFGRFAHIVDIGGGDGIFLEKILERYPALRGTLFDQPEVINRARRSLSRDDFGPRCDAVGGNFFKSVPTGGDAYLLKWILHDWSDTAAIDILKCCRSAMKRNSLLLLAEFVIGPGYASPEGELMDLTMMVMNGGRERTLDEFSSILAIAGFRLLSVTRTSSPFCVIEAAIEGA